MNEALVKRCACGLSYTREQWEALPDKKVYELEWLEVHEQRRCSCGSHLVLVLKEGEKADPEVGAVWYHRKSGREMIFKEDELEAFE